MSNGIKRLAEVAGKQLDNRLMTRKFVTHQKTNECLYRRSSQADMEMHRPGNAWKWVLKKLLNELITWCYTCKSARREVLHTVESTYNQKINDRKWQPTEAHMILHIRHRLNLGEAYFGLQSRCMFSSIQYTECSLSIIKPRIRKVWRWFETSL